MDFSNIDALKESGWEGFFSISQLWINPDKIPDKKGVYCVVNPNPDKANFLIPGVGGFFKGKNPNVTKEVLTANWIPDCPVVYIGKAGGDNNSSLRKRIKQYLQFGQGKNIGHYGGRLIWQLANHKDLLFCWFPMSEGDPKNIETNLLNLFFENYGKLPFANLT